MKLNDSLSGLASIIIPSCNPLESTRQCIAALRRYTRRPWELIVVNDGSSDEAPAYLERVRDAVSVSVTVITNVTSREIAAAINQGLKAARGERRDGEIPVVQLVSVLFFKCRGSDPVPQPIMPLDLPVKVRPWELTVYPRSHIRRWFGVTRPAQAWM